jgi:hypothetical protein
MSERQIRIFVPPDLDQVCWAETVVGRVIAPVVQEFSPGWIWFSRYEEGPEASSLDSDISKIPMWIGPDGYYRSVRFRVSMAVAIQREFEQNTMERINDSGFAASGFLDYLSIDDLGSGRFIAEPGTLERRRKRADLMAGFLNASANLFIDALIGPDKDGLYHVERNSHALCGSFFSDVRHLFCNMTNAPTPVFIDKDGAVQPHPSGEIQVIMRRTYGSTE